MNKKENINLIFATNNPHKLQEVRSIIGSRYAILSLEDIACREELPESHDTMEENAFEKANYIYRKYDRDCFAEDTGLVIAALNGDPGVYSARYAGPGKNAIDNMKLVLQMMNGKTDRSAIFKAVICLIRKGKSHFFTGITEGSITGEPRGIQGFGYDPVFQPGGYTHTFAEIGLPEKNRISHRYKAMQQLMDFLTTKG